MERDATVMIVAANIQSEMARAGLNAAELSRAAGLNATGVYDILSGKSRNPRLDTISKIATALGVPVVSLFRSGSGREMRDQIMDVISELPEDECRRLLLTARAWVASQT